MSCLISRKIPTFISLTKCDQQDPTDSSPGFQEIRRLVWKPGDSSAGSAGPADNQPWIPLNDGVTSPGRHCVCEIMR